MNKWHVVTEPVGRNPGLRSKALEKVGRARKTGAKAEKTHDNIGGIVVYLQKGHIKEEVTRVGWVRATSENPNVSFRDKLREVMELAEESVAVLNRNNPDGELV